MMLVDGVIELSSRTGDVLGSQIYGSSPTHGFLYCVIATTVVYRAGSVCRRYCGGTIRERSRRAPLPDGSDRGTLLTTFSMLLFVQGTVPPLSVLPRRAIVARRLV
jgi:hypothetical protein